MQRNRNNKLIFDAGSPNGRRRVLDRLIRSGSDDASSAVARRALRLQNGESHDRKTSSRQNPFDIAIECVLAVLLGFSAFAFGATEVWSGEVTLALCGASLLALCLKLAIDRRAKFIWSWTYLPMGLFVGLVAVQCINLPARWISLLSPEAIALRSRLLGIPISAATFSLYPLATQHQVQFVVCAAVVFVVVLNVYQQPDQVIRLLATISIVGGGVILIALYQNISGSRMIYGLVPAIQPNSGPFMNYGHYAQFTNLSLGAAFGLLLYQLERLSGGRDLNLKILRMVGGRGNSCPAWLLAGELVIGTITVFLSMSRMGALSMIAAAAITAVLISARGRSRGRGTLLFILAAVTFAGLLYAGFDSVFDRLATFRHIDVAQGGRWEILRDLRGVWREFPILGTGLGTHEFVFPMFDHSSLPLLATFAENEFAQLLEETGTLGLAVFLLSLGMILFKAARIAWKPVHRLDFVVYGLLFGLLAALFHSFSDFGQHVPAIAYLTSVECGLVVTLSQNMWGFQTASFDRNPSVSSYKPLGLVVRRWATVGAVAFGLAISLFRADSARAAEAHENAVLVAESEPPRLDLRLDVDAELSTLDQAKQAVALEPHNVSFKLHLANHAWELIADRSRDGDKDQLTLTSASVEAVRGIVDDLKTARRDCPTFGPLYSFAGQLEKFVLNDPAGDTDIRKGAELTSYDANACFLAGQLDAADEHWDLALTRMRRAVDLNESFRARVVDTLAAQDDRPDLASAFTAGHRDALIHLSELLARDDRYRDLCVQLQAQSVALLQTECQTAGASPGSLIELGDEYQSQKREEDAIQLYRRALSQDYGQVEWRLKLAEALAKTDRSEEAIHEARICLQFHPALKTAEDLIAQLSVRRGSAIDR